MKTTVFKRMLSVAMALVIILSCFAVSMVAYAASNIKIAGVDIGYASGDYYTKNGNACAKHEYSSGSNCMGYYWPGDPNDYEVNLLASQCMGYARYCQWKVYGYFDYDTSKFNNLGSLSAANCTESKVKNLLEDCNPATHVRLGNGHSVVIISADSTGVETTDCNSDWQCGIRTKDYTWKEFANYTSGRSGISYAYSSKEAPKSQNTSTSNPFLALFQNFFKILIPMFSVPGIGPIFQMMFKGLFS